MNKVLYFPKWFWDNFSDKIKQLYPNIEIIIIPNELKNKEGD